MELLALNSGGIDSPVATHRLMEKGMAMRAVVFDNRPYTSDESIDTAIETIERLAEQHDTGIKTYIVPHGFVQEQFLQQAGDGEVKFSCIFSRRMMLRIATRLAEEHGLDGLVTGDNLAQVASQTLDNMVVINEAADLPVFRPLLGENKNDVVEEAREIGTFKISSQGGITCGANPDYPETHAFLADVKTVEAGFDIDSMVEKSISEMDEQVLGQSS